MADIVVFPGNPNPPRELPEGHTAEVLEFTGAHYGDIPPEKMLRGALEMKFEELVIVGRNDAGDFYFATSSSYKPDILWLLSRAQRQILADEDDDFDDCA